MVFDKGFVDVFTLDKLLGEPLIVTYGLVSESRKREFFFGGDEYTEEIKTKHLLNGSVFEIQKGNELIGLCSVSTEFPVDLDSTTRTLSINLNAVYIKEEYRGIRVGVEFATVIGAKVYSIVGHEILKNRISDCKVRCEYSYLNSIAEVSNELERFGDWLFFDFMEDGRFNVLMKFMKKMSTCIY